jgi:hypothetical protein
LAKGWGKASVGEYGILLPVSKTWATRTVDASVRENKVKRYAKLLRAVKMGETRWIRNYCICHKTLRCGGIVCRLVAWFDARSPTSFHNLINAASLALYISIFQCTEPRQKAWIADHERHKLGRVTTYIEELEIVLLNRSLEHSVSGNADSMTILLLQGEPQSEEWFDIST